MRLSGFVVPKQAWPQFPLLYSHITAHRLLQTPMPYVWGESPHTVQATMLPTQQLEFITSCRQASSPASDANKQMLTLFSDLASSLQCLPELRKALIFTVYYEEYNK